MLRLLALFTIVPAIELWLLLQVGVRIGPTNTLLFVLGTGLLGAWLARTEGLGVLRQLVEDLQQGVSPGPRIAEGALVLVGALLLVTPGVLTDLTGILILLPPIRRFLAPRLVLWVARNVVVATTGTRRPGQPPPAADPFASPFDEPRT